jgi:hypothetical protein
VRVLRTATIIAIQLAAVACPRPAAADAVPPPPSDCPPGTRGVSNHSGQICAVAECADDRSCGEDQACGDYPLCVARDASPPAGLGRSARVGGRCERGTCPAGFTCEPKPHCVPRTLIAKGKVLAAGAGDAVARPPPVAGNPSACGCFLPGAGTVPMDAGAVFLAAALLVSRRRRPRG